MTRCRRCHRRLKDPVSIERELGPSCYKKVGKPPIIKQLELFFETDQKREVPNA
ncbi:DUF6011 domain-containing protein [Candidatus Formimonas warabiya]|uniref:DUF6011 domain-containing protein n=1 Tax=Formimonas warabiya TaxID=1761012 RepID=UPI003AB1008B